MLNMVTGINELNTLIKHISCECKCKFDGTKFDSNEWWNSDKCQCDYKKHHIYGKDNVWNAATCNCENGKYLASIMDDSAIIYNEIIGVKERNLDEKIELVKHKVSKFYLLFY